MKDQTAWTENMQKKVYPKLEKSTQADIAIIGGGLAGLLTAYLLTDTGKKIIVIEKDEVAMGVTSLTTAFLTQSIDIDFTDIVKSFDLEDGKDIVDSHGKAIDLIEKIVNENRIDCDFKRCSNYIYELEEKELSSLEEENDAALELGLDSKFVKGGKDLGFENAGYMEIKNQAMFHPLKFLARLAHILEERGVEIYEHTEACEITRHKDKKGVEIETAAGIVDATWAVSTVYKPFKQPLRLFFKKGMYVSYIIEGRLDLGLKEATYEDTENPYHYFRIDGDRIIIGGEDHRQDIPVDPAKNFKALHEYAEKIFPKERFTINRKWSGPILEPVDGLAFIGPLQKNDHMLYAFGFSGNGMTYSAISAMILSDCIRGTENKWHRLYRANRLPHFHALMIKGRDYTEELAKGALKNVFKNTRKNDQENSQEK
jgi:glycine/D-amino acid oxidase-like deaminating enzyme